MLLAYTYPLLSVFWSLLEFALLVLWIFIVIWCFIDNFRRRDHHGVAKALWFVFIVFVPVIGVIAYIIARPPTADLKWCENTQFHRRLSIRTGVLGAAVRLPRGPVPVQMKGPTG